MLTLIFPIAGMIFHIYMFDYWLVKVRLYRKCVNLCGKVDFFPECYKNWFDVTLQWTEQILYMLIIICELNEIDWKMSIAKWGMCQINHRNWINIWFGNISIVVTKVRGIIKIIGIISWPKFMTHAVALGTCWRQRYCSIPRAHLKCN